MDSSSEEIQRLRIAAEEQRILNADLVSQIRSLEAKLKMKDDYIKSLSVNETRESNDVVSRGEDDFQSDDKDESEGSSSGKDDDDLVDSPDADFGVGGFDESFDCEEGDDNRKKTDEVNKLEAQDKQMLNRNSNRNQSDGLDSSETLAADEAQEKLADKQADVSTKAAEEATRVEKEEMERRAENQRLEKERTDRERQRREVLQPWKDMQQSLAHAESDELITLPLVAGETDLLSQLYTLMDRLFDTRNPDLLARLPSIVDDFICLLAPLIEASNVVASHRSRDASKMASEFSKGGNATLQLFLFVVMLRRKKRTKRTGLLQS